MISYMIKNYELYLEVSYDIMVYQLTTTKVPDAVPRPSSANRTITILCSILYNMWYNWNLLQYVQYVQYVQYLRVILYIMLYKMLYIILCMIYDTYCTIKNEVYNIVQYQNLVLFRYWTVLCIILNRFVLNISKFCTQHYTSIALVLLSIELGI